MLVELLKCTSSCDECGTFVARNAAVWTAGLRESPGFVRHELLRHRQTHEDICTSISRLVLDVVRRD